MSDKMPKVIWSSTLLRLVAIPGTKYPYGTIFVFESMQKDSLGFESWRQVERITDSNSPIWQFIDSLMTTFDLQAVPTEPPAIADKMQG